MKERVIGIDAGGTMTKAALFDLDGVEQACARRPNQMLFPAPGHTERDPNRMWRMAAEAIREVLEVSGTDPSDVAAVSVAGYGSGLYLIDTDGNPVRNGIVSTDGRTAGMLDEWKRTGLYDAAGAAVQQRLFTGHSAALIPWLDRNEPGLFERTHAVAFCKDFLRGRLTGDYSTDPSDGGIAGLIDVEHGAWSEPYFEMTGIARWLDRMPEIRPSQEIVGGVTEAAARLTGLRAGTPVVRGAVDVSAAAIASGVLDPGQLSVVAGTFSINSTLHDRPRLSILPFIQSPYPLGGFIATEGAATSASNLEWFIRNVLDGEAARAEQAGRSIYDVCNDLITASLERDNDILFFPFLFGGPGGAPAGLLGLRAADTLGDVLRAIFEGIVYAHKQDIDRLLTGHDAAAPSVVRLAGGASRSPLWAQMFADALEMPVEVPAGSELGAQGVAILAAAAIGAYPDLATAARSMTRVARRFEPRPERSHARKYARYAAAADALSAAWSGDARKVA